MTRVSPRNRWFYWLGAAALVGGLGLMTIHTLQLETREARARDESRWMQATGLALYRMDFWLTPLVNTESMRLRPPTRDEIQNGIVPPFFVRWMELRNGGSVVLDRTPGTPEAETGSAQPLSELETSRQSEWVRRCYLAAFADNSPMGRLQVVTPANPSLPGTNFVANDFGQSDRDWNRREFQNRSWNVNNAVQAQQAAYANNVDLFWPAPGTPAWVWSEEESAPRLHLVHSLTQGTEIHVRVVEVDWPQLARELLNTAPELGPDARLAPRLDNQSADEDRHLASIPAILHPGEPPASPRAIWSGPRAALGLTWFVSLTALIVLGRSLNSTQELSERRGRFVSAVTHELRTPLTTFRMYAEMLADGMVRDDKTREEYLHTLKDESGRLARVVESVLLFSRLEDGRSAGHREAVRVDRLLDQVFPSLLRRVEDAGHEIVFRTHGIGAPPYPAVTVDVQGVEQILLNLVDNSCKYGADSNSRVTVTVQADLNDSLLSVSVQDGGPGVPKSEQDKIFEPFHRSAVHQAGEAPGVGLGLSVARGLAIAMGGSLELVPSRTGAAFVWRTPVSRINS